MPPSSCLGVMGGGFPHGILCVPGSSEKHRADLEGAKSLHLCALDPPPAQMQLGQEGKAGTATFGEWGRLGEEL